MALDKVNPTSFLICKNPLMFANCALIYQLQNIVAINAANFHLF